MPHMNHKTYRKLYVSWPQLDEKSFLFQSLLLFLNVWVYFHFSVYLCIVQMLYKYQSLQLHQVECIIIFILYMRKTEAETLYSK